MINDLQAYTEQALQTHNIPALSIAVWKDNKLHQGAAGVVNLTTGVKATTDTLFQIGSITKVMTTCLIMQLVDEGKVELDNPVKHYLRDFLLADTDAAGRVTVRQLLNHTSGIAGDYFPDDNDHQGNLIARYVDRCSQLPIIHPMGKMYSYSNSAFGVAGRLIEVVRGMSWYQVMRDYLYQPLGMDHAIADPKDLLRYRVAMGHVYDGDNTDRWVLPTQSYLTLGLAPVGSTPAMTAADLVTFARAHLNKGKSETGQRWLSTASVQAMQTEQIALPSFSQVTRNAAGLGWALGQHKATGIHTVGHTGAVRGSQSILRFIPEQNAAFAIVMNGFRPSALSGISYEVMEAISGVDTREPDLPGSQAVSEAMTRLTGRYESFDTVIDIALEQQQLTAHIIYKIDPLPPQTLRLIPLEEECFGTLNAKGERGGNMVFVTEEGQNSPGYIFNGGRLNARH